MPNAFGLPRSRYRIVLADPPWPFRDRQANRPATYARMRPRDVRTLPVQTILAEDAALFLWSTGTHLVSGCATSVIEAWGFRPVTVAFVWSKVDSKAQPHLGMGHWTRQSCEFCLLGIRGEIKRKNAGVRQLIQSVPEEHSKKPDEIRDRIVELLGDLPRVELFARQRVDAWDAWGDELPSLTTRSRAQQ